MTELSINRVSKADSSKVVSCLYDCYWNDPTVDYIVGAAGSSEKKRESFRKQYFKFLAKAGFLRGDIYEVNDFKAVILCIPPGNRAYDKRTMFRAGLLNLVIRSGWEGVKRAYVEYSRCAKEVQFTAIGDRPCFRITHIGVRPGEDYLEYLEAIVKYISNQADEKEIPCYIENTFEKYNSIYQRLGFYIVGKFRLGEYRKVPVTCLLREVKGFGFGFSRS
ncbi:hypothetical protein K493DRAFT_319761 [Basidiobolus meristosporus CBS 931.73]|uniref:N-acetyltransferase domain-containing protein n=1 Tax=Basidiobolus meristosporus CBS 931.73 TaxID=1314790 RepID=A0A1Y1XLN4_9FUNG|nr:hypothetical protein K493DRAFT_319761 [Basidiobolus meristosporus CBS 931.73]|eukprot:ORX86631.1 hypothetical protein K493DRAFT_319761 [Basidiobolus meristosporus CBS 931.73]